MTATNREPSILVTLGYEGGYTNHPRDPGGPTNWGITIYDARMYWKPNATAEDVKAMPRHIAVEIYRQKYWAKLSCDARPAGVDLVDFDFGVNSGVARAKSWMTIIDKGGMTPVQYVKAHCAKRMGFLRSLRTFDVFGKGWSRRVANVEAKAVAMALKAAGKPVEPALRKSANEAKAKSAAHTTAATGTSTVPVTLPDPSSVDLTSKAGMIVFGVIVVIGVAYFVWHAVQHAHRSAAYTQAANGV
jgi:lysozyme family protein